MGSAFPGGIGGDPSVVHEPLLMRASADCQLPELSEGSTVVDSDCTVGWSDVYQVGEHGMSSACQLMVSPGLTGRPE